MAFVMFMSIILGLRLAYMQVFEYKRYQTLSLKNQLSIIPIAPPRGIIVDRNGVILAENRPVYVLELTPDRVKDMQKTIDELQKLLPSITSEDIRQFHRLRRQNRSYVPVALKLKLTANEVATVATQQYRLPGVEVKARLLRYYPHGEHTSHVVGYVGRINTEELRRVDPVNYRGTNYIGKSGIEKYYEDILHGQVGYQQLEIDVSGRTVRSLQRIPPVSGHKLRLTLDMRLQEAAYNALADKRGAVVAIDPRNGEILAFVSAPGFDANLFVNGINQKDYHSLSAAKTRPLYNRAARGLYPPASTVKPYVALGGLHYGLIDKHWGISDPGFYRLPGMKHAYRDWKKGGHGGVNVERAVRVSCDTFFYHLGHNMGILKLAEMYARFGFGQATEVDLTEELPGILPNPTWKRARKGQPWYPGDTVITSIGQGFMLATPLQLARAVATLSQRGQAHTPHLLLQADDSDKHRKFRFREKPKPRIEISNELYWDTVIEAMHSVITNLEGTGYRFGRDAPYSVAAKTGTAQVFSGHQYEKHRYEDIPEFLRDNSLFIAFAPVEAPEIALAVVVENDVAASFVARKVLNTYFELKSATKDSHAAQ